jgi:hypothetical protein
MKKKGFSQVLWFLFILNHFFPREKYIGIKRILQIGCVSNPAGEEKQQ